MPDPPTINFQREAPPIQFLLRLREKNVGVDSGWIDRAE